MWDLQCTLSYLPLHRVLTALRFAYARGKVSYVVVKPTGGTSLANGYKVTLNSILSRLDQHLHRHLDRHHTSLADELSSS